MSQLHQEFFNKLPHKTREELEGIINKLCLGKLVGNYQIRLHVTDSNIISRVSYLVGNIN